MRSSNSHRQLVQVAIVEARIKRAILWTASPGKELKEFLMSSPQSLEWLARQGSQLMLNMAISLDYTFGPELMSLILK